MDFYFSLAKENNSQLQDLWVANSKVTKTMVAESIVTKTMVLNSFQRNYGAEFFSKLWFRILFPKTMVPNSILCLQGGDRNPLQKRIRVSTKDSYLSTYQIKSFIFNILLPIL